MNGKGWVDCPEQLQVLDECCPLVAEGKMTWEETAALVSAKGPPRSANACQLRWGRRGGVSYVLSDVTCLFLSHIKKKIKSMRNNNTKLETIISLLNPGNIKWEMNRFNKNDVKGRYNLSYSFISRKLKQNTHLIHRY